MRALKEKLAVTPSELKVPVDQYMHLLELGIKGLTQTERQVIFLRFWEPFTIGEVAERMGLTWDQTDDLIDIAVGKIRETFRLRLQNTNSDRSKTA